MRRWKKMILGVCIIGITLCFLLGGKSVRNAVTDGLLICVQALIPSLFPLSVMANLILFLGYGEALGRRLSPVFGRLLGSGAVGTAMLLGLVGGYPIGAQALGELTEQKRLKKETAERLLGCCNNAGPAFIIGTVGLGLFESVGTGVVLYLIHALSAVLACAILSVPDRESHRPPERPAEAFHVAFPKAVVRACDSMLHISGFVVFFFVLLSMLRSVPAINSWMSVLPGWASAWLSGLLELSCGVLALRGCDSFAAFLSASGLLAWGGVCVWFQALSAVTEADLSGGEYWRGKLLQTLLSLAIALPVGEMIYSRFSIFSILPIGLLIAALFIIPKIRGRNLRPRML